MKKINFKKTVSVALAALALCPAIASVKPMGKVYATDSFCSGTGDWIYNVSFDESQITIDSSESRAFGTYVDVNVEKTSYGDTIVSYENQGCSFPKLTQGRIVIPFVFEKINKKAENRLKAATLKVKCEADGYTNSHTYKATINKKSDNSYELVFDNVIFYGNIQSFETYNLPSLDGFKCDSALIESNLHEGYYYLDVKTPDGENLYIKMRKDKDVDFNNLTKWAKRLCVYANALSKTTNVQLGTLYLCFDYPTNYYRFSGNGHMNSQNTSLGLVASSPAATDYEISRLRLGNDELTWGLMHEISHSYSNPDWHDNYYFSRIIRTDNDGNPQTDTFEEFMVNVRGLTAIQNCDNLINLNIYNDDWEYQGSSDTYDKIFNHYSGNDPRFLFAQKLASMATKYNAWDKLEQFFAATGDNDYLSMDNVRAAKKLNSILGDFYTLDNINNDADIEQLHINASELLTEDEIEFLIFTNTYRKLYMLFENQDEFDEEWFEDFILNAFGKFFVLKIFNYFKF